MHTSDFNFLPLLEISVIYGEHFCTKIRVKNKNDKKSITLVSDYVIFSILIRMENYLQLSNKLQWKNCITTKG